MKSSIKTQLFRGQILLLLLLLPALSIAQNVAVISLAQCYKLAKENYPLTKQKQLIESATAYNLDNASKGYLPQFTLMGQATYQSAVTQIPIKIPNVNIQTLSKDQYKIYGEVYQPITETTVISSQKALTEINGKAEESKADIEIYKLNDRINQIYFGILLLNAQKEQLKLLRSDLAEAVKKAEAMVKNGVALRSNVEILQAEILKAEQKEIELNAAKLAYIKMLQAFINVGLTDSTQLEKPAPQRPTGKELSDSFAQRPESMLFTHQYKMLQLQQLYLAVKNLPRLGLFAQGGYGRPALNMLNNDFSFYYIGGLRFSWNFTGLYTLHNDKKLLDVQRQQIDVQHELFIFNNMLASAQQKADMEKWDGLILRDKEIVQLREKIKNVTKTQLENGTATANDLSRDISAVDQARQNMALHEMQYLMAQYNYQTTTGTNQYIETK